MADTGLCETAARATVKSLVQKTDIEITAPPSDATTPTTYIVWGFAAIIERRAARGLLYCERIAGTSQVRLLTEAEARERRSRGEPVKQRAEHSFEQPAPLPARPPADSQTDVPAKAHGNSVAKTRRAALALKPEEWNAIHAELGELAEGNLTAEADLIRADREAHPGEGIEATRYRVRSLAHQVRASRARGKGIHSPIAWMLTTIGAVAIDLEAERAKELARSKELATETAARAKRQAEELTRSKAAARISAEEKERGRSAWKEISVRLKSTVPVQSYETWLKPTKGAWMQGRTLTVYIPSPEFGHIGDKFRDAIEAAAKAAGLKLSHVRFLTQEAA
jgi:hypothetical protein